MMTVHTKTITSPKQILDDLQNLQREYPEESLTALKLIAEKIMRKSKEICPVDTGHLRGSGYVRSGEATSGSSSVELGYSADYAAHVHERLYAKSGKIIWHKPPTQPKFLETPLFQVLGTGEFLEDMHARILKMIGGF